MAELSSVALAPESWSVDDLRHAAEIAARTVGEAVEEARARIAQTRFVIERISAVAALRVMDELSAQKVSAFAFLASQVLPPPRAISVEAAALPIGDFRFQTSGGPLVIPIAHLLHAHYGATRVESERRILTRAGMVLRVAREVRLVDLYFRGGAAYRIDFAKVSFAMDPRLKELSQNEAAEGFLWELLQRAREIRRPILPGLRPISEGFECPLWQVLECASMEEFEARGRWWFTLAANKQLPPPQRLDELLVAQATARGISMPLPPPATPGKTAPLVAPTPTPTPTPPAVLEAAYNDLLLEGAVLEERGQIALATVKYRLALEQRDTFEARLALIESLVDTDPFESWERCRELAARFPAESAALVEEYRAGPQGEDAEDRRDFLTYRALRRSLRRQEMAADGSDADPLRRFFISQDLTTKMPDPTKTGLLDAYGSELGFRFPEIHRRLISSYNGLDLFNRAFRFLGVGGDDESFDLFLFNDPVGWRRFYGPILEGLIGFGYDYLGDPFFYDPRRNPQDPTIVRLDADTGELEPIADSLADFLAVDLTDSDEDVVRPRLLRLWQKLRGQLGIRECLSFKTSPVLGGARTFDNLTTSELGIRLHMAGQVASQAAQIPEGARILGVRVVNQEELLLKIYWEY